MVAHTALRRLGLDRLWWVVTPGNPLKANDGLPPLAARMAQAQRLARHPRMCVTGFESQLGTAYTAQTLAFLVSRYPGVHWVWVMGADNLASFHRWQHWRRIAELMPIAVVDRPGYRLKALASPAARALIGRRVREAQAHGLVRLTPPAWTFLGARLSTESSTEIRARQRTPGR
jgi:nicotinate-nucleotide adenylyltransferase